MSVTPQSVPSPRRHENRQAKKPVEKPAESLKVHVTGFPPYTRVDELKDAFASHENCVIKLMKNYAIVTLPDKKSYTEAIANSKKICVYGQFLNIKPYKERSDEAERPKPVFQRSKEKSVIIEPTKIDLSDGFLQQLDRILAAVRLTQEEVASISQLYVDLETVLRGLWPGCQAFPFGSIATGLGIKTSDADCFIDLPEQFRDPAIRHVVRAKKLLQKYPKFFTEIFTIPNAHTPIVKLFYLPTETNCDVSFKTPLGVRNSKLVGFLLQADTRLIPVAVAIKYWAKVHGFSGSGKLTNYALTLLFIFYLQQEPAVLPSVCWLQRDPAHDFIVDGWNTGFPDALDKLPKSENNSTISELLGGFFEYYANFDFDETVVCPFLGRPIKKSAFTDLNSLPEEMARYRQNIVNKTAVPMVFTSSMCVQDPLKLSHNVASSVNFKLSVEIKAFFKFAADAYKQDKENECRNLFKKILLEAPVLPGNKFRKEYRAQVFSREFDRLTDERWKNVITTVVNTIFEQICLTKLERVDVEAKPEANKDVEQYASTLTKAVWKRKKFAKIYNYTPMSFLEKQNRISNDIVAMEKDDYDVKVLVTLNFPRESRKVPMIIKYVDGDKCAYLEFAKFFVFMVNEWFFPLMRPLLKEKKPENSRPNESSSKDRDRVELVNGETKNVDGDLNSSDDSDGKEDTKNSVECSDVAE